MTTDQTAEIERLRAERTELIRQRDQITMGTIKAVAPHVDRAAVLREAADDWTAHCPDHSDAEDTFMDCPCDWADELRRKADEEPQAEPEAPPVLHVGDRYQSRDVQRTVTISRLWTADDGHDAVAYEWTDDRPGQCGSACPVDVFHQSYRRQS